MSKEKARVLHACVKKKIFSLQMHAKPSFAHRLQTAKMASSRTSAQNNGPSHVGKYDRADDRPKLAILAANVGYRYWTDDRSRLG